MRRRTTLRAVGFTLALTALPTMAAAVGVNSYHGQGSQHRTATYNNGAQVAGSLESTQGYPVYYEGRIHFSTFACSDTVVGRYTNNTSSKSRVNRGGVISAFPVGRCSADSVDSRISRDIAFSPDPSGAWSANY